MKKFERFKKPSFVVIGREGSTADGEGFIARLWEAANAHFTEVAPLAVRDEKGGFPGFWGAMTDFSRAFQPWEENFTKGLYLAGAECRADALPPAGWTKWVVPAFEMFAVSNKNGDGFPRGIAYLRKNGISLAAAAQDFICPETGEGYVLFPVTRL